MNFSRNFLNLSISAVLFIAYICIQYLFSEQLSRVSTYATYFFDLTFVIIVWLLLARKIKWETQKAESFFILFVFIFPGAMIHFLAIKFRLFIPFDLGSNIAILLLLLIGPILEELVFRFAFWKISTNFFNQKYFVLFFTSVIFSYSHFHAFWFVPEEFRGFVLYQTAYTFFLGLSFGFIRQKFSSLWHPMIAHGAFNLGFYIVRFI